MHALLQYQPRRRHRLGSRRLKSRLVRTQFAFIQHDADAFTTDFFNAFFARTPSVRTLFHGDMSAHRVKFMQMLAMLVSKLHTSDAIAGQLAWLGLQHRCYGVLALDYDRMGDALLETLARHLGSAFHASARTAWSKTYVFIASGMQSAHA